MISQFFKIAGVTNAKDFYAKYPNEEDFFKKYPETQFLQKQSGGGNVLSRFTNGGEPCTAGPHMVRNQEGNCVCEEGYTADQMTGICEANTATGTGITGSNPIVLPPTGTESAQQGQQGQVSGGIPGSGQGFHGGINVKGGFPIKEGDPIKRGAYDFNYALDTAPDMKSDLVHHAGISFPNLFNAGKTKGGLGISGMYAPNKSWSGNLKAGIPLNYNGISKLSVSGGLGQNFAPITGATIMGAPPVSQGMMTDPTNSNSLNWNAAVGYKGRIGKKGPNLSIDASYHKEDGGLTQYQQRPGTVTMPYASSDHTYMQQPFQGFGQQLMNTTTKIEQPSGFNYQKYHNNASKYLSRPVFKGTGLSADDIATSAQDFYNKTGYEYPLDLLLSQGQMETGLGTKLKSKNNYFNVGNYDNGRTKDYASAKDSLSDYMKLMYNDYLQQGKIAPDQLLSPGKFVNTAGNRYASAADYEQQLANQKSFISKKFMKQGGYYSHDGSFRQAKGSGTMSGNVYYEDGGMYNYGGDIPNYMKETSPMYNFGGYFPQGPRFAEGGNTGEPCYDNQGNVVDCAESSLASAGSSAYTRMQPFYNTVFEAAQKYANPETGMVSPFNSARAQLKGIVKNPGLLFAKRHTLSDTGADPYNVGEYTVDKLGNKTRTWWPEQWAEPKKERTGFLSNDWFLRQQAQHQQNRDDRQSRRHRGDTGCYGANCVENNAMDQSKYGGLTEYQQRPGTVDPLHPHQNYITYPGDTLTNNQLRAAQMQMIHHVRPDQVNPKLIRRNPNYLNQWYPPQGSVIAHMNLDGQPTTELEDYGNPNTQSSLYRLSPKDIKKMDQNPVGIWDMIKGMFDNNTGTINTREDGGLTMDGIRMGQIPVYEDGGIHIKPSHRGRFTEYKERTGKTTEEALHSPNAHVRQMANFARNAAKWKHEEGGLVAGQVMDVTPDMLQELERGGYTYEIIND